MSDTSNVSSSLPTSIALADGAIPVHCRAGARGGAGPVLLIAPSAFGITDDLVGQMDELAEGAGVVVAMDLFWRGDHGPLAYTDMRGVMARLQALDLARAFDDYRAVVAWARAHQAGADVIGLGICFGGVFTFRAAAAGLLDGVITWHGTRLESFVGDAAAMRCPMSLHFGERDRVVPMSAVEQIRQAFAGRDDVEIVVHPGADHGFTHSAAPTWDPQAAASAMRSVRAMLGRSREVS